MCQSIESLYQPIPSQLNENRCQDHLCQCYFLASDSAHQVSGTARAVLNNQHSIVHACCQRDVRLFGPSFLGPLKSSFASPILTGADHHLLQNALSAILAGSSSGQDTVRR